MSGDSDRRFANIMQKLSQSYSPRNKIQKPYIPSDGIGTRRSESGLRVSTSSVGSGATCRPWDRGDLMRRLATFKAMTWFAKPKVVNAVNCARRGWINVEMDVISCQACGARILFSTQSSWSLQQVEKAAAVFSLKLDNGHKLLCPWIHNACDEALAFFPPLLPPVLVDGYKERSALLLQLTALPVISSSAIYYMRSPQLEHFLSESSKPSITLDNGLRLTYNSGSKEVGAAESDTAVMYFQALKIISLCGWEPRLLPYLVDNEDQLCKSSEVIPGVRKDSPIILTSGNIEVERVDNNLNLLSEHQYDPASVVLDCKLCGACVGLWAFATVQRPLEDFTFVQDPSGQQNEPATSDAPKDVSSSKDYQGIGSTSKERHSGLNLTIAGGPPPTEQSFRPTVSFPIVSRHLRAKFNSSSGVTDYLSSENFSVNPVNSQLHAGQFHQQQDTNGGLDISSEGAGPLKRKRNQSESCISERDDVINNTEVGEKSSGGSSGGRSDILDSVDIIHKMDEHSGRSHPNSEGDEENVLLVINMTHNNVESGENICTTSNTGVVISNECENNSQKNDLPREDSTTPGETSKYNLDDPSNVASSSAIKGSLSISNSVETEKNDISIKDLQNAKANQDKKFVAPVSRKGETAFGSGDNSKAPHHKVTEFDPIRQHRPFCPWIAAEDCERLPGWRLTLAALTQREKDGNCSCSLSPDSPSTPVDEVEDPVFYIRQLFSSPPKKKLKGAF